MFPRRRCFSLTKYPYRGPQRFRTLSTPPFFSPRGNSDGTITITSDEESVDVNFNLEELSDSEESFYEEVSEEEEESDSDIEILFEAGRSETIVSQILSLTPLENQHRMMELLVELRSLHK